MTNPSVETVTSDTAITVREMRPEYNREVSLIMTHGFHGKFSRTKVDAGALTLFFELLLKQSADIPCTKRVVAVLGGKIVGTMSLKWHKHSGGGAQVAVPSAKRFWWKEISGIGAGKTLLLLTAFNFLQHYPVPGECYIADLAVDPELRGRGVGRLLLNAALQYMKEQPLLYYVSLHVAGHNRTAQSLYERTGFSTQTEEHSLLSKILYREETWKYMIYGQ